MESNSKGGSCLNSESVEYIRKAEQKLEAARELFRKHLYEDATSRAYYCVLNAAKAALASEKLYPKTHHGVLTNFGEVFIKGKGLPQVLGSEFSRLKTLREKADYSPRIETSRADAEWSIRSAEQFLIHVKKLKLH